MSSGVLVRGKESLTGALYAADWGIKCPIPAARWYHLEELRSQLHTGDVVLFRSRTITAMFRARLHGEVFSHCGIVVVLKVLGAAPHPVWLSQSLNLGDAGRRSAWGQPCHDARVNPAANMR